MLMPIKKAVYWRSRGCSKEEGKRFFPGAFLYLFAGIIVLTMVAVGPPVYAEGLDQLNLTGTIKSINMVTGIVYVEVVSSSCLGMRMFKADDPERIVNFVDQKVSFFIDDNACRNNNDIQTMIVSRGLRQ